MKKTIINNIIIYAPKSRNQLIDYAMNNKSILVAINAEKILSSNEQIKNIINRNVGYPDGIGAVLALEKNNLRDVFKIPGCELWLDIVSKYYKTKSFYLVGSTNKVINETVIKLKEEFNGIKICNFRNGYIESEKEKQTLIEDIIIHQPDVIFVAMGSPIQEILMDRIQKDYKALCQGLGGSFDVYTEIVKRAPKWWINNNLEWAFRLFKQPTRIRRQLYLIKFYILLISNKLQS